MIFKTSIYNPRIRPTTLAVAAPKRPVGTPSINLHCRSQNRVDGLTNLGKGAEGGSTEHVALSDRLLVSFKDILQVYEREPWRGHRLSSRWCRKCAKAPRYRKEQHQR